MASKPKQLLEKCLKCAPLSVADARAKHPNCWDDKLCHARRSYARNRDRRGGAQASRQSKAGAIADRKAASNSGAVG